MRRVGGLFAAISERENLQAAAYAAARGKRHRREVISFFRQFEANISRLSSLLASGGYRFSAPRRFEAQDTKTRTIHAPVFVDRVVHHAVIRVTGPVLELGAIAQSFACRSGRGQHAALRLAKKYTRRSLCYGKLDFRRYYDSVDHSVLKLRLARRFQERSLLALFDQVLDSWSFAPARGLPIGALTSQYLGNFYLDAFDSQMQASGLCGKYVRYMDDIVIWGSQMQLSQIRSLALHCSAELKLEIKHGGEWNRCHQGLPFLGFIVYPDRIRLGRQARRRFRRKFRHLRRFARTGQISEAELQARLTSLFAHVETGDDLAWRKAVLRATDDHFCG